MPIAASPVIHRWSTDTVPAPQRFDYWEAAVADALTPMRLQRRHGAVHDAHFELAEIGPIQLLQMTGAASTAVRYAPEIERSAEHTFHLLANRTSAWTMDHCRSLRLGAGDAVLTDSNLNHWLEYAQPYDVVNLRLPARWVRQWLPRPCAVVGRRMASDSPWGRALTSYILRLHPSALASYPLPVSLLADHVGALLALVMNETLLQGVAPSMGQRDLATRVREVVRDRSAETSLTAHDVAVAVGVSVRTLHRALLAGKESFSSLLMATRAERAVAMLESRTCRRLSVAEIGARNGFPDPSHFARVIRRRIGHLPSAIRARALGRDGGVTEDRPA